MLLLKKFELIPMKIRFLWILKIAQKSDQNVQGYYQILSKMVTKEFLI